MTKPLAWITGAGGLIGSHLLRDTGPHSFRWQPRGLTRADVDLADFSAVQLLFAREQPDMVIHCAAMTRSPACQQNPSVAKRMNVEVTAYLAELAQGIPFLFFSTDLVFDGQRGNYDEASPVNPLSVYGESKVAAERLVLSNPRHTVVRTSLNYGTSPGGDRAFNEELRKLWQAGGNLTLFTDEFRCPIAAEATASAVWELASVNQPGLYHLAGSERLSRYQIGELLAAQWPELNMPLVAGSLRDYRGAPRAPDTSLNCAKIQKQLSTPLPCFSEWLAARRPLP